MLAVLFGLSTDYEVFLLSRVREEWDRTGDNTAAVAGGLQRTGGIITAAALLLIILIGGFTTGDVLFIKMIGFGMIVALVVDATIVRALLAEYRFDVIYQTPRLTVRQWTDADADVDRLFDIYSRWEVARWLGAEPRALETREQAVTVAHRFAAFSPDDPTYGVWAVEVTETGVVAGSVLLARLPGDTGEIEVGWHLHPDSWGHGYATEAAKGALDRAWQAGLSEVFAVVRPGNDASMAVCRRLGMAPLGRTGRWYGVEAEAFRITP